MVHGLELGRIAGHLILTVHLEPAVKIAVGVFSQYGVENIGNLLGNGSGGELGGLRRDESILDRLARADYAVILYVHDLAARIGPFWSLVARRIGGGKDAVHSHGELGVLAKRREEWNRGIGGGLVGG